MFLEILKNVPNFVQEIKAKPQIKSQRYIPSERNVKKMCRKYLFNILHMVIEISLFT